MVLVEKMYYGDIKDNLFNFTARHLTNISDYGLNRNESNTNKVASLVLQCSKMGLLLFIICIHHFALVSRSLSIPYLPITLIFFMTKTHVNMLI